MEPWKLDRLFNTGLSGSLTGGDGGLSGRLTGCLIGGDGALEDAAVCESHVSTVDPVEICGVLSDTNSHSQYAGQYLLYFGCMCG